MATRREVPVPATAVVTGSGTQYFIDNKPIGSVATEIQLSNIEGALRGHIIRGNNLTPEEWEAYDASADGHILVGDGDDLNSVAVSGDATLDNAGALTINPATLEPYKTYAGFFNRTDSSLAINSVTGVFTLDVLAPAVEFVVFVNDQKFTLTAAQTVTVTEDQNITFIYLDATGTLQKSTTPWSLASGDTAPVAIVFKDGASYALTDERHGYERNKAWHRWAHFNIGAMYKSGLAGTFADATLSVTQGVIYDEDIRFDTGGTQTTATLWYRNGLAGMRMLRNSPTPYRDTVGDGTGILQYDDDTGVLANVTNNRYSTQWVYCSNDPAEPIYVVIGQNNDNTVAKARNATLPINNLDTAEWKLIYRVIYQNKNGDATYIEAADFRAVQTGVPTSALSPTSHAILTERDAANSHPASAITEGVTIGRLMQSDAVTGALEAANVVGPAVNVLTLAATVAATLTVPATGTAALLEQAQTFTAANTFQNAVNSTGALVVNNAAGTRVLTVDTIDGFVQIESTTVPLRVKRASTTLARGAAVIGERSRGTLSSPAVVIDSDRLFYMDGRGYDGAGTFYPAGVIGIVVDGTPGAANMPGRIEFRTQPAGGSSFDPPLRMSILSTGSVLIGTTTDGMTAGGSLRITQDLRHAGDYVGFYNKTPVTQPAVPVYTAIQTTQTAGATYTANEQTMLANLKTDVTNLRAAIVALTNTLDQTGAAVGLLSGTAT